MVLHVFTIAIVLGLWPIITTRMPVSVSAGTLAALFRVSNELPDFRQARALWDYDGCCRKATFLVGQRVRVLSWLNNGESLRMCALPNQMFGVSRTSMLLASYPILAVLSYRR
jgi:hypothetical protein